MELGAGQQMRSSFTSSLAELSNLLYSYLFCISVRALGCALAAEFQLTTQFPTALSESFLGVSSPTRWLIRPPRLGFRLATRPIQEQATSLMCGMSIILLQPIKGE